MDRSTDSRRSADGAAVAWCTFERISPQQVRCRRCRRKLVSEQDDPARIITQCRITDTRLRPAGLLRQAWNVSAAVVAFVADGLKTVSAHQYRQRLDICDCCPQRQGNRCAQCGCWLSLKARGRAFQCPLEKWPPVADP